MSAVIADREGGRSLRSGFLRSASAAPGAPALVIGDRTWSYGELEETARSWSQAVIDALDRRPARVGVLGYRSECSYAGVLAALFSGAAFVPFNPTFPAARTGMMMDLADIDALLVESRYLDHLEQALSAHARLPVVVVTDAEERPVGIADRILTPKDIPQAAAAATLPPVLSAEAAYLLFTSGSTGLPKGVPVTHSNVLHFIDVMMDRYGLTAEDRLSQTFDQSFDLSVFDLFMAWEAGASVHVLSAIDLVAPTSFINRHELTTWFSVPSMPALMRKKSLLAPDSLPTLRWSLFCGEALPQETAEAWQLAAPGSVVENLYGPTELTIACFAYRWDQSRSPAECVNGFVPIGRPYPGLGAVLLDEDRNAVGDGEPGELYVCGPQAVPGYWRDSEKTAERFPALQTDGSAASAGTVFYCTGDRVVRDESGRYAFLGRADNQIKTRGGYRVELGEIESALRGCDGLIEAVALGWPVEAGIVQGIVAFVSGRGLSSEAVLAYAGGELPKYLVPDEIAIIDEMPLNVNGKVDRGALMDVLEERTGMGSETASPPPTHGQRERS